MKKVDLVVDLQYGSTGKGLIAGYLAEKNKPDVVVNANMPNAGHTYINAEGRKWVHKVLPNGIVSPNLEYVLIGPGSVFELARLHEEIAASADVLRGAKVIIHGNAAVLNRHHGERERQALNAISSTMQGSAEALIEKMRRNPQSEILVRDAISPSFSWEGVDIEVVTPDTYSGILYRARRVLAEGAQGYSLGISQKFWPYCTSRDCTPTRFMADMAIPHKMLDKVIGTARCHPIRVGSTQFGYSGDCYPDQTELQWSDIGQEPETTTVTGRVRRVFSFSRKQIREAIAECQPDEVFLNFCNYTESWQDIAHSIEVEAESLGVECPVQYLGFGPTKSDVYTKGEQQ